MTKTAAILFDLDGTLLDTAPEFSHCLNLLLTQEDKPCIETRALKSSVSFGAKAMVRFGFKLSEQDPSLTDLLARFLRLYEQNLGQFTQFFPGMENVLASLALKNIPWGIVTNKPLNYTLALIEHFDVLKAAKCVLAGDSLAHKKPHPLPLLHAAQQLKVEPEACWYIGDAKTDLEASRKANMRCAIANYGYIPLDEDSLSWDADKYLNVPNDIAQLFLD